MVAAKRQELGYPLRLFSIPNCFRYERPQKGRLREFWQLNADIFGVEGIEADIEMIQLADSIMKSFGAKDGSYEIRINSRKILNEYFEKSGAGDLGKVIRLVDKYEKLTDDKFHEELNKLVKNPNPILDILSGNIFDIRIDEFKKSLKKFGVDVIYDPKIARGFDYYTDIVFEVFDTNPDNNRSMFGGGRYDGLVGQFGVDPVPTVGFGMGDLTFENFLRANDLVPELKNSTDLVLITIGDVFTEASKLAGELRQKGLNVSLDATDRKIDKKIKAADKQGVEYVLFVGETELKAQKFNLKNLKTGKEIELTSLNDIYKKLRE